MKTKEEKKKQKMSENKLKNFQRKYGGIFDAHEKNRFYPIQCIKDVIIMHRCSSQ